MRFFGHHVHAPFLWLGVAEFVVAYLAYTIAERLIAAPSPGPSPWGLAFGVAVTLSMLAMGLYQPKQRLRTEGVIARQAVGLIVAATGLALADLFFDVTVSGMVWILSLVLCAVGLALVRAGFWSLVDGEAFRRRVLVVGAGERASRLLQLRRRSDQRGFRLVAFVPTEGDRYVLDDSRVVQLNEPLLEFARAREINEIVVAIDDRRRAFPVLELLDCRFDGIDVMDVLTFIERETGRVQVDLVTPDWMIFSAGFRANPARDSALRALDLIVVLLTSVITVPLMLAVATAILLEDGRPVLYRQARIGLRGRPFVLLKFRSMVEGAESDGLARWADESDERVTRAGRVIRKYRLDELPQLLNVIRGDMSLVGPRPERPEFIERLSREIPYYAERHCVKPGITGWAQMSYPYGSSDEDATAKLAYDLYYLKHRSIIFNLVVLLQTAEVILWSKGAR